MKVVTVVGTRPEIIRLSRVLCALDRYFEHKIVHTGQNYDYELNQIFFDDLELRKPDYFLDAAVGNSTSEMVGAIIAKVDVVLAEEKPDAVLLLGDTNSTLGLFGQTAEDSGLPHGSWKPLFRSTCSGRNQPQSGRSSQRHQSSLFRYFP